MKIDRTFTELFGEVVAESVLVSTVEVAHRFGLTVVAEGVDSAESLALVRSAGCDAAQGYLFGRALSVDEATSYLVHRFTDIAHAAARG